MTDTQAGLLPCPFCCQRNCALAPAHTLCDKGWHIECVCGAKGPVKDTIEEAANAWNIRPSPPASAEVVEDHRCDWRLKYMGLKAHWDALGQELTKYGVPENWPEYQELRKKMIDASMFPLPEKPSPQDRIAHYFASGAAVQVPEDKWYRNKRGGWLCRILGRGSIEPAIHVTPGNLLVMYQKETGDVLIGFDSAFDDRFEAIAAAPQKQGA